MSIDGVVLYTDGSSRLGQAGWGLHGYTYKDEPFKKLPKGLKQAVPTAAGYVTKDKLKDPTVQPIEVIMGWGAISHDKTNNHGELLAMHRALTWLTSLESLPLKVRILADSMYVINALTEWLPNWIAQGWRNSTGKPVAHKEKWLAIKETYDHLKEHCEDFELVHIKAHAGHYGNEEADKLAKLGSMSQIEEEHLDTLPYDEWHKSTIDHDDNKLNPLLFKGGLFFESNRKEPHEQLRYFLYHLRSRSSGNPRSNDNFEEKASKRDVYLGTWVPDQVFAVIAPNEEEPIIEDSIKYHDEAMPSDYAEYAVLRLDNVTRKSYLGMQRQLGEGATAKLPHSKTCVTVGDLVVSRTLRPPLRAFDAAHTYDLMNHTLTQFIKEEEVTDVHVIDLTERLFESKQKTPKSKVTWKTRADIPKTSTHLLVEERIEGCTFKTKLIFGTDLPERLGLDRIASDTAKVYLYVKKMGIRFTYDILIRCEYGHAIFTSPDKQVFAKE